MINMTETNSLEDSSHEILAVNEMTFAGSEALGTNSSESDTHLASGNCDADYCRAEVVVTPKDGLHMVPCSLIVKAAQPFECEIEITKQGKVANAKAIFDLLGLVAEHGCTLVLEARGKMAQVAIERISNLFHENFVIK